MSLEPPSLKRGDFVQITHGGRRLSGMVYLASSNGRSLIIGFDGMLGGWVGVVPLSWTGTGYYECFHGQLFELKLEGWNHDRDG